MKPYTAVKTILVMINFGNETIPVGRLALRDRRIYFSYELSFLEQSLEISPFSLPLQVGVKTFDHSLFEGLPGVFNDSLPDGWGRLLLDRFVRSQGILPSELSPLDRLAMIGSQGLGVLVYKPEHDVPFDGGPVDLNLVASQVQEVLEGSSSEVVSRLLALNGSSSGARPKALIGVSENKERILHGKESFTAEYEPWLVKFPNTQDGIDAGAIEYVYALMAKQSGILMPEVHLFSAHEGPGYFAAKRFDRNGAKRLHMHTASGLLHADFRFPSLDYQDLLNLTSMLTRDVREVEKMYRLAVFNVLAHNRDDHAKNFSFLMDAHGKWTLSPAYDLTFSSGPGGEQSTMVMGEGRYPDVEHLLRLGLNAKLSKQQIASIIDQTRTAISGWNTLARQYGVSNENISLISQKICQ